LTDVAAGLADLVQVGTRAFGVTLGVNTLAPLELPLLFRDAAAVASACSIATAELDWLLDSAPIVGLAVVPGALRYPFGLTRPLVGLGDWRGAVIRTHASVVGEATIRAFGARPVYRSAKAMGTPRPAGVDGMDLDVPSLTGWGYGGYITDNVPLWPRTLLLGANRRSFARLDSEVRQLLYTAAQSTTVIHSDATASRGGLKQLSSVAHVSATDADIAELREAVPPVYDQVLDDSHAAELLGLIRAT
jgi:TRAP-type C4-dicarboxylate transport system substrate-binding protein